MFFSSDCEEELKLPVQLVTANLSLFIRCKSQILDIIHVDPRHMIKVLYLNITAKNPFDLQACVICTSLVTFFFS